MDISEAVKARSSGLADGKRALLERRLRGKDVVRGGAAMSEADRRLPSIAPDPAGRYQPFDFLPYQQQLWQATHATGITPWFYFETERAELDIDRFEQAWRSLVARHGMLRAVVLPHGAQQVLERVPAFTIVRQDLSALPAHEQERAIEAVRVQMTAQPRPQDRWPLFEIRASRLGANEYRLHFGFNLQLFDLASIELLAADCKYIYHGETERMKPLEIDFRDMVVGESRLGCVPEVERAERYWQERFALLPPPIELGTGSRGSAPQFAHHRSTLVRERWQSIKDVARHHGVTGSMVVFAAFNEVLRAHSGREHYALESRVFRRLPLHRNVLDVAGQFVAGIVSEIDLRARPTFLERCQGLERRVWQDLEHGYVDAARRWHQQRALAPQTPGIVYTSTVARFENFVRFGAEPPLKWFGREQFSRYQMPNLGLEFFLVESAGNLESNWFVDDAWFGAGQSAAMFEHYCALLTALAHDPALWNHDVSAFDTGMPAAAVVTEGA